MSAVPSGRVSSTDDVLADLDRDPAEEQSTERQADRRERRGLRERVGSRLRGLTRPGLGARLGRLFSPRTFLVVLGLSVVGTALAGVVPLLEGLAPLLGAFLGGFLLGVVRERRAYLEVALAGAGMAAVAAIVQYVVVLAVGEGATLAVVSGGAGLFAGVVGHYFGRDLRDGVTRDL